MKTVFVLSGMLFLVSCISQEITGSIPGQTSNHPYKSIAGCERTAPVGTFDEKCDIPVVGWKGAEAMSRLTP